jgi:nucleotide-binding universal stress UspA family protein
MGSYELSHLAEEDVVPDYDEFLRWRVQRIVEDASARAGRIGEPLEIATRVGRGTASDTLLAESATAEMAVVGSRRLDGAGSFFLGSVGTHLAMAAPCPVVVIREAMRDPRPVRHVVAGIDLTPDAQDVLAFAFDFASRHDLRLRVLTCVKPDPLTGTRTPYAHLLEKVAEPFLAESIAGWQERYPDVKFDTTVVCAHPVPELVACGSDQALLVVGKHRHRPLVGALLGSVSQGVLHHAACSVAVVPVGVAGR